MTYDEALAFIHGAYATGRKNGLENMRRLLEALGNPGAGLPMLHVGGTNGKGSVCAFAQAALRVAGYRTGLYTSPFLQRYNERIRVDGVPIADAALADVAGQVAEAARTLQAGGVWPTEFELGTAIALCYFARSRVDVAVIEVGLGGQLDPTNVITPCVTAIAAIGFDHTAILGTTIESIAAQKAGIAKPGVPMVLSGGNTAAVQAVIRKQCEAARAPLTLAGPSPAMHPGMPGEHQAQNAGVAAAAVRQMRACGIAVSDAQIDLGIQRACWPGRLEWVDQTPPVLLDGAHNAQGAAALAAYLGRKDATRTALVFGTLTDKDWQAMALALGPLATAVFTVRPESPRGLDAAQAAGAFEEQGTQAVAMDTLAAAMTAARAAAGPSGRVVIAGSLYLIGAARSLLGLRDCLLLQDVPRGNPPDYRHR